MLALPPLLLGTRLPRQPGVPAFLMYFRRHRRRLHPDRGGADSEVRAVPGPSDLRADGDRLLDAGVERAGSVLQPPRAGRFRDPAAICAGGRRGAGRRVGAGGRPGFARWRGWPLGVKFLVVVLLIAPAGFLMGMPFPTGLAPSGGVARAVGALGVVAERRIERAGLGRGDRPGDLPGPARHAADRGRTVPGRAAAGAADAGEVRCQ